MQAPPGPQLKGFSLLELMIAIAIIGILAAIVIPTYQGGVRKANEASAVAALNTIRVAQTKFGIDHQGKYGNFKDLFSEGYLDKRFNFDTPVIRGYIFRLTLKPKSEGQVASYSVNADPEQSSGISATGRNFYYFDPESGICFSRTGTAGPKDDAL